MSTAYPVSREPAYSKHKLATGCLMTIAIFGLAPALIHPATAVASDSMTETAEAQHYRIEIGMTTLSAALKDLARQTSLQFARFSDVAPKTAIVGPLSGTYTRAQALDLLLRGTGLTYRFVNARTVAIIANAATSSRPAQVPPPLLKSSPQSAAPHLPPAAPASSGKSGEKKSASKKRGLLGRIAGFFALCGPLFAAGPAFCQNAAPSTSAATGVLQEVVVTAERRSTDIMSTPVSIVAVSGAQLQESQIVDVNSLGQVAPSLLVINSGLNSTANIRGVGNSNQGGDEVQGVAIVHDGLPNNTAGFGDNAPYFDIADIEVLRGPQGTFTAANSTGGSINVNTANPNFRGINGYFDATAATYSEQRLQGAINVPVTDTLALRLAFNEETRGSFFRDQATLVDGPYEAGPYITASGPIGGKPAGNAPSSADQATYDPGNVDDRDMRLGLLWKPTVNFQMLTKIGFYNDDSAGIPTQPNTYTFSPLLGLPCPKGDGTAPNCHNVYAPGYSGSPYELNNWASSILKANNDSAEYSEEVRYSLSSGIVLRTLLGVQEINSTIVSSASNDTMNVGSFGQTINHTPIYSGEFDAISPTTGPFSWIVGASMYYTKWQFNRYTVNANAPFSPAAPQIGTYTDGSYNSSRSHAVFGQVSWQFTPTLQLVAGGRMSWDGNWNVCNGTASCNGGGLTTNIVYAPGVQYIRTIPGIAPSDRVPTGKIDLNWTPLPGQLFYGFVARGYKPGENNAGIAAPAHYEWVTDYETGWKAKLIDNHLNLQVDGYYMQYEDMIHSTFNPEIPTSSSEANIPSSILKGIEATVNANLGHLSVDLNAAYNKSILGPFETAAKYKFPSGTFFGTTPQCAPGVAPSNTATGCSNYLPYMLNLSGEPLPNASQYTFNGTLRYSIPVGDMYVVPRVQYSYRSKAYSDIFQSDNYYLLPGYFLWSAYLDWEAGPWTATIYGTNLANSVYLEGTGLYGNPRQLGLEVRRTF